MILSPPRLAERTTLAQLDMQATGKAGAATPRIAFIAGGI